MQHTRKILAIVLFASALVMVSAPTVLAGSPQRQACVGAGGTWTGSECVHSEGNLEGVIENVINALLFLIGIVCVIVIIIGGIMYATSAGDTGRMATAKNTILYAIIGLIIALLAFAIVNFILEQF